MTAFRHPAFAKLSPKIDRAGKELREVENYLSTHVGEISDGEWGVVSAVSLGIYNIYNDIEDILISLAKDVDGLAPSGSTMHQDVLDQMSAEIANSRPAVLVQDLYEALTELKGFRHLVRHRYGFELKAEKVQENLDRVREAFPAFVTAIISLEKTLTAESGHDNADGDGAGGERQVVLDASPSPYTPEQVLRALTPENCRLLALIHRHRPQSITELCRLAARPQPNVSRSLASLERAGIISMVGTRPKKPELAIPRVIIELVDLQAD